MKCIKLKNGLIKKLGNRTARELVNSGKAIFIPKHVFKHEYGVKERAESGNFTGKTVPYICKDPSCTICGG